MGATVPRISAHRQPSPAARSFPEGLRDPVWDALLLVRPFTKSRVMRAVVPRRDGSLANGARPEPCESRRHALGRVEREAVPRAGWGGGALQKAFDSTLTSPGCDECLTGRVASIRDEEATSNPLGLECVVYQYEGTRSRGYQRKGGTVSRS